MATKKPKKVKAPTPKGKEKMPGKPGDCKNKGGMK